MLISHLFSTIYSISLILDELASLLHIIGRNFEQKLHIIGRKGALSGFMPLVHFMQIQD